MSSKLPELLTPEQVAAWLGVSRKQIYNMVARGQIPKEAIVYVLGERLRFLASPLKTLLTKEPATSRPRKTAAKS